MSQYRVDPLLHFLLGALGMAHMTGCGGNSESTRNTAGSAGAPLAGTGGTLGAGGSTAGTTQGGAGGTVAAGSSGTPGGGAASGGMPSAGTAGTRAAAGGVGGSAAASGVGGGAEGGGSGAALVTCGNGQRIGDSGWETCDGGVIHRPSAGSCPMPAPPPPTDCDCTGIANGWCLTAVGFTSGRCVPGCSSDADCANGQVCFCDAPGGRCIAAECATDADCAQGSLCATYSGMLVGCAFVPVATACLTPADQCFANADCKTGGATACGRSGDHRACLGAGGCGRPFLVDGVERRARAVERRDWLGASARLPERLDALGAEERARHSAYFVDMARSEHASIAAFARFSLQLLALGAPSELLLEAARATADETRHAELAFALASAYAAEPLGPSPLTVHDALAAPTLENVLGNVVLEGCIGEALAAAEARELSLNVEDPVLRAVFAEIAHDEARHAALAYRFVQWAATRDRALITRVVRDALARELPAMRTDAVSGDAELAPLTPAAITPERRARLRRQTLERVVRPCFAALLGTSDPGAVRFAA